MTLRIHTLGPFEVFRDGAPIPDAAWKTQKNKQLCKVLLTHRGHALTKDQLMEWLWPELPAEAAGRNLRVAVSQLRKALEPERPRGASSGHVRTTPGGYAWGEAGGAWVDADAFERACAAFDHDAPLSDEQAERAERAKALYRGPYLEEDRYEDWAAARRERLQERYLTLLTQLAEASARQGRYRRAIELNREVLEVDACRESTWRQLMRHHYFSGNQPEALRAYEACVRTLAAELDVAPGEPTRQLAEQIRRRHLPGLEARYPPPPGGTQELPYTLSPGSVPFVGRRRERARLKAHLDRLEEEGRGGLVWVGGEAGVGKTRLVQEALDDARAWVLEAACQESARGQALRPWARALAQGAERLDDDQLQALDPLWWAELADWVPGLGGRLPDRPPNPALDPDRERLRRVEAVRRFLEHLAAASGRRLVVCFDDAHWMDEESLALVRHLLPRLKRLPVLILGTHRQEDTPEALSALLGAPAHALALARLSAAECRDLLRRLPFAPDEAEAVFTRLYRETEGNPLFLIATLQHGFETGALAVSARTWTLAAPEAPALPATVAELLRRRLARLDEAALALVRWLCVLGREVELDLLEALDEGETLATLLRLSDAQLLVERRGRYRFGHGKVGEVAYAELSEPLRQLLHQRVLGELERRHAGQPDAWAAELAHHAERAGDWDKALRYAARALERNARAPWREQLHWATRGLAAAEALGAAGRQTPDVDDQAFTLLRRRAALWHRQGRREEEAGDLARMAQLAERLQDPAKAALVDERRAAMKLATGEYADAARLAERARAAHRALGDARGQAVCLTQLGTAHFRQGNGDAALQALKRARTLWRQHGSASGLAETLVALGQVEFFSRADYDAALALFDRAQARFAAAGDLHGQAKCLLNVGNVLYYDLGRHDEAVSRYRQALEVFRAIGDRQGEAFALHNVGNVYRTLSLGRHREGLDHLRRAHDLCIEMDDAFGVALSLQVQGRLHLSLGDHESARPLLERALALFRQIGDRDEEASCLHFLGVVQRARARHDEALALLRQAEAISRETGDRRALAYGPVEQGETRCAQGAWREALDLFQRALDQARALSLDGEQVDALTGLAKAHLGLGQAAEALAASTQAVALADQADRADDPAPHFVHHRALAADGQAGEAAAHLARAHDAVQRVARLLDGEERARFIGRVPIHREVLAAWRARSDA